MYIKFNTQIVLLWRIILEEYGPMFEYIKEEKNIVADALSWLDCNEYKKDSKPSAKSLAELYSLDEELPISTNNV